MIDSEKMPLPGLHLADKESVALDIRFWVVSRQSPKVEPVIDEVGLDTPAAALARMDNEEFG